ncbi:MAG: metal-dependent hydrolase [Pseudomonadota bacterium]
MDNLSHSLAGLAAGELVHRSLPQEADAERNQLRRRLLLTVCWLGSNFPDLDLVLTPLLPAPLGYLLHHRGHTHTLLYALPQALLLWGLIWLLWPSARMLLKKSGSARLGFALVLVIGFGLHLLMDYLNSYGIHPFHPFDSRWLYGDMVYIVEPVFWVACGIPLFMTIRRLWLKALFVALLFAPILFFTIREFLPWTSLFALAIVAFVLGASQLKAGARGRSGLILAAIVSLAFVGIQGFASGQAKRAVATSLTGMDPASRLLDVSLSSFPGNPLCWNFVSVESNESAGTYRLRRGVLSVAPGLLPVSGCPAALAGRGAEQEARPAIAFLLQEEGKLKTLRDLKIENCHFEAWLRFARAPSLTASEAADLRFASSPRGNFTSFRFDEFKQRECPRLVPQWDFPRSDLLKPTAP